MPYDGRLTQVLWIALLVNVGETLLSWLVALGSRLAGLRGPSVRPYYFVLMADGHSDRHLDLWYFWLNFQHWHRPGFFTEAGGFAYPPANALLLRCFLPGQHPDWLFQAFITIVALVATVGFAFAMRARGLKLRTALISAAVLALFSAPLAFEYNRLNTEIVIFAIVASAIYCLRKNWLIACSVLLGLAIALKLYPVMLLALLFSRKKWAHIALALGVAGLATLAGLWGETGSLILSWHGTANSFSSLGNDYIRGFQPAWGWDHSIFGTIKLVNRALLHRGPGPRLYRAYMLSAALGCLALYFGKIIRMPQINQIGILVLLTILVPPISFEYTLLHVYTVLALLACHLQEHGLSALSRGRTVALGVCLGVPLGVVNCFFAFGSTIEGQVKCVSLLALLLLLFLIPFREESTSAAHFRAASEGLGA
ncbi:hypothetical protein GCM10022270_01660 [Terriglobus aquaticus]